MQHVHGYWAIHSELDGHLHVLFNVSRPRRGKDTPHFTARCEVIPKRVDLLNSRVVLSDSLFKAEMVFDRELFKGFSIGMFGEQESISEEARDVEVTRIKAILGEVIPLPTTVTGEHRFPHPAPESETFFKAIL